MTISRHEPDNCAQRATITDNTDVIRLCERRSGRIAGKKTKHIHSTHSWPAAICDQSPNQRLSFRSHSGFLASRSPANVGFLELPCEQKGHDGASIATESTIVTGAELTPNVGAVQENESLASLVMLRAILHQESSRTDEALTADDKDKPVRGEIGMWRAVITQALMDAFSNSAKKEFTYAKRQARVWLEGRNTDFYTVCECADLDPDYVREQAKRVIEERDEAKAQDVSQQHTLQVSVIE